ncbi:MAG TPA: hypothetical protein VHZ76_02660 [Gammaproteobacteria bacterium]|nr:hypothetical protein [Gammaproteobacteria bacterium]
MLTAIITSQPIRHAPLKQSVILFFIIMLAMLFGYGLMLVSLPYQVALFIFLGLFTIYLIFIYRLLTKKHIFYLSCFLFMMLLATVLPMWFATSIDNMLLAVIIGAVIGTLCHRWIFPSKLADAFRYDLLPILHALATYADTIIQGFKQSGTDDITVLPTVGSRLSDQYKIETILQRHYPEWVYEIGFNPGLRGGFRFFLIHLEYVIDLFFALDNQRQRADAAIYRDMSPLFATVMEKNKELLLVLINFFEKNVLSEINDANSDFTDDMQKLEQALREMTAGNLELLNISDTYLALTAMFRDIKDIRQLLLQLVAAL